ncbi:MAG: sulfatase-like hydrolase/transferase [Sedimentisphaerales bacterium]|nr:sulfatase-like hydrolase/transferase [Sedimentisphaerales bacterium]
MINSCQKYPSSEKPRQIILISIDTCRADHLSCYGYSQETTPHIDALAQKAILFNNAITPVPLTLPAHSSMMTGTIPNQHGVHDNMDYQLGSSNITLAEILGKKGYKTAAIVSSFVLDHKFGLDQGFESYNDQFEQQHTYLEISERRGEEVTRLANQWLDANQQEEFFFFLHYYDPHADYRPPEPYATKFKDHLYAGEIAYTDHCIGGVIDKLKQLGIYDSALVIIVGDHGEGLGEHGENFHSYFVYQSTTRVPLIVKPPNSKKGQNINRLVGLIDIVPTVLGYAGIPVSQQLPGEDLRQYQETDKSPSESRYLICESLYPTKYGCNPLLALVGEPWKYIYASKEEIYNLEKDADETINLADQENKRARFMQSILLQKLDELAPMEQTDNTITLDAQSRARLESLGYVSGHTVEGFDLDSQKPDPKEYINFHRLSHKYQIAMDTKHFDQAIKICTEMLKQYPERNESYYLRGYAASEGEQFNKAIADFGKFLQSEPDNFKTNYRMGLALMRVNRLTEAVTYFEKAVQAKPDDYMTHGNLALVLNQLGKYAPAEKHYREVLRLHPGDADAHANLAVALVMQDRRDEAVLHYKEALIIRPNDVQTCINLGKVLAQQKKLDQAFAYWNQALQLLPAQDQNHVTLRDLMAQQLAAAGKIDQAVNYWKEALKWAPNHYGIYYNLGLAYSRLDQQDQAIAHWEKALQMAETAGNHQFSEKIKMHLQNYQSKQPSKTQ